MTDVATPEKDKKSERNAFLFIAVFLGPILSIAIVGGIGFTIWMSQLISGPPSGM